MAETTGHRQGQDATRALVERIASGEAGAKLRSQLVAWHRGATVAQVEDAFQEACLRAHEHCLAQREGEVFVWLRTTAQRELWRMQRRAWLRGRKELLAEHGDPSGPVGVVVSGPEEELLDREDEAAIERISSAVFASLSERQREIVGLHLRGHTRVEIAEHLGMTSRTVKRQLERAMAKGRVELVGLAGHGCEAGEPLVTRFAFGLAEPRDVRLARLHLAGCGQCGALYEQLNQWRERVAALLPIPAVAHSDRGLLERMTHHVADHLASARERLGESTRPLRQHLSGVAAQLKQQAHGTYYRAIDPTPLAGVRPGALATVVAGCVAVGGGVCAQQGLDPISGLRSALTPSREDKRPAPHVRRAAVEHAIKPAVVSLQAQGPAPSASSAPVRRTREAVPASQSTAQSQASSPPEAEFEPDGAGTDVSTPASASSTRAAKPAPAPASGPGEFDGP